MLLIFINSFIVEKSLICFDIISLLNFSFITLLIGLIGTFYNKQNLLVLLLCIELMLLAVGLNFVFISLIFNKLSQVFVLFIICVAAVESSIGLGLLILLYRVKHNINFEVFSSLKF
jgi:NADH-quinone oxidoreductase subunit K